MTLHHAALEVRSSLVEDEIRFWALLGFGEVEVPETLAGRTRWVARGATQIHLLLVDDREPVVMPEGHVAVIADDITAVRAALLTSGHPAEDHARHWGAERLFTRSPAGHRVEVMAFPPPSA